MNQLPQAILGISPGTRSLGIAILKDGELLDSRIKSFPGKWSEVKQKTILGAISEYINHFGITVIALKTIHISRSAAALNQVIHGIKELSEKRKIKFCIYTIHDLKKFCLKEGRGN